MLVWGQGDGPKTRVLDKVTPPTVHNLLALNTVLDHLSKFWPGDLKEDLKKELNIIPHSYQGKEGAYAGPECDKVLSSLDKFQERISKTEELKLFFDFLNAFNNLKNGVFGSNLSEEWKELCLMF